MKSDRKPPVVRSPMKIRGRRPIESTLTTPMRTPIGAAMTKTQIPNPTSFRNYNHTVSNELKALTNMVQSELANIGSNPIGTTNHLGANSASVFERGRFYDQYAARRNERLKRKRMNEADSEPKSAYNLGVKKVESVSKKKDSKKLESLKKSASVATRTVDRSAHPRYALRSIKKPPLPVPMNVDDTVGARRKTRGQRVRI